MPQETEIPYCMQQSYTNGYNVSKVSVLSFMDVCFKHSTLRFDSRCSQLNNLSIVEEALQSLHDWVPHDTPYRHGLCVLQHSQVLVVQSVSFVRSISDLLNDVVAEDTGFPQDWGVLLVFVVGMVQGGDWLMEGTSLAAMSSISIGCCRAHLYRLPALARRLEVWFATNGLLLANSPLKSPI